MSRNESIIFPLRFCEIWTISWGTWIDNLCQEASDNRSTQNNTDHIIDVENSGFKEYIFKIQSLRIEAEAIAPISKIVSLKAFILLFIILHKK